MKKFVTLNEIYEAAIKKTRKKTFIWAESGAEDDYTTKKNIEDLKLVQITPRVLRKIKKTSIKDIFFKTSISCPLILAPMGHQTQFHKNGEIEMAKGAVKEDILSTFTTQGRIDLPDIVKKSKNQKIIWQIFLFGDKNWILKQIRKAEANNCLAISICLDAPNRSYRYSDRENRYDARKYGNWNMAKSPNPEMALNYDFKIIEWIKSKTKLPIIPKGIMHVDDSKKLLDLGADAIWLSNHGGRMVNSGISVLEILRDHKNKINKNIFYIVDGGVRKGSDVFKYIISGADLVAIGRPALYGLMANGSNGVENVFSIFKEEMDIFLKNSGIKSIEYLKKNRELYQRDKN